MTNNDAAATRDPYTMRHLDAWLDKQIHGDSHRERVRECMLALVDQDPEYWGAQGWWHVYDRAGCFKLDSANAVS